MSGFLNIRFLDKYSDRLNTNYPKKAQKKHIKWIIFHSKIDKNTRYKIRMLSYVRLNIFDKGEK